MAGTSLPRRAARRDTARGTRIACGPLAPAGNQLASSNVFAKGLDMAKPAILRRNLVLRTLVSIAVAAGLVALATAARVALEPQLGPLSPFMLYVAAVLAAGLIRGPLCGAIVMLAGGVLGVRLFLVPHHAAPQGSMIALMLFWGVSAPVLLTANELRVQLGESMARLTAALQRSGRVA
jgi:K+-sensing histidine kinase KdpD